MLEFKNVSISFGKATNKRLVLKNINLTVEDGEFLTIIGKSGCGKTTLLNVAGKILRPDNGIYLFDNKDVSNMNDKETAYFRNRYIGFITQRFSLIQDMNVYQNIALPLRYRNVSNVQIRNKVYDAMSAVNIEEFEKKYPYQLSGGECQRVAIARIIAADPQVILADEPTGALDMENGNNVMEIINKLNKKNKTILMVTHDMDIAAQGSRTIMLKDGEIV